jgi:hypothetical protein
MDFSLGNFRDERIKKTGAIFFQRIIEKCCVCLRKIGGNRSNEVRFGRFLANPKVTVKELIEESSKKTGELVSGYHALAIQDTTELNYHSHAKRVTGLGPLGNPNQNGLFLHPLLVLEAKSGTVFGLGDIHTWIREVKTVEGEKAEPKKKKTSYDYQKLLIEEKESYRWLAVAIRSKITLAKASLVTIIADRESDIYEEWYRIPDEKTHLLTRSSYNRRLANGKLLFDYIDTLDVAGVYELELNKRVNKRSAHTAKLEVRFGEVEIKRPQGCSDKNAPKTVKLTLIDVRELPESVVGDEEPIHWRLLTTHSVNSFEDALEKINWYCLRWNIEQLFRTIKKQGFQIESSQVETGESLTKLAIIALRAAVQTMQLTLARDDNETNRPASDVFEEDEISVLSAIQPGLEGKTEKQKNPYPIRTLAWVAWIIARLGGWKGYASESPPGPITMLNGQIEFASICRGWWLAKNQHLH